MSDSENLQGTALPEVAFYYPGPLWHSAEWVKNLLLFFDGIALLIPEYMSDRPEILDPSLAIPLREAGLLHILHPETLVNKTATEDLALALTNLITSGALDPLRKEKTRFQSLSWSRLGGYGDEGLARMILEELKARDLAHDSEDGVSIPMHPTVRALVLVLLAQILRPQGSLHGLDLAPATDQPRLVDALKEVLSLEDAPSSGHVVSLDLRTVGVDLSHAPIDEVLDFRREHLALHRKYAQEVRRFVRDLGLLPPAERQQELADRQRDLSELEETLRRVTKQTWKRPAGFALGIAGAVWTATTGDPLGAIIGGAGAFLGLGPREEAEVGAFSYLFRAREKYA